MCVLDWFKTTSQPNTEGQCDYYRHSQMRLNVAHLCQKAPCFILYSVALQDNFVIMAIFKV